jgi:hypothetical protein
MLLETEILNNNLINDNLINDNLNNKILNNSNFNNNNLNDSSKEIFLNYIRDTIENMNKFNQIEVLRILSKDVNIILNENKYGIHVNLSEIKEEIISDLSNYIQYVNTQEQTLNTIEKQKEDYRNTFFSKDIKINK